MSFLRSKLLLARRPSAPSLLALAVAALLAEGCRREQRPQGGTALVEGRTTDVFASPDGLYVATLTQAGPAAEKGVPRDVRVGALAVSAASGGPAKILGGGVSDLPGAVLFAPGGKHLGFLASYSFARGTGELRLARLGADEADVLAERVSAFFFSGDGRHIGWIREGELHLRETSGGEAWLVTRGVTQAEFGPAGTPLAGRLLIRRSARQEGALLAYDLGAKSLEAVAHGASDFGFSPTGEAYAFQARGLLDPREVEHGTPFAGRSGRSPAEAPGLYVARPGAAPRRVAADEAIEFQFSPDGRRLAWITSPRGGASTGDLYLAEGDAPGRRIAPRVNQIRFSRDGTLALLGAYDTSSSMGTLGLLRPGGELVEVVRNVKLFTFSPKGTYVLASHAANLGGQHFSIALSVRRVDAPAESPARRLDTGVFGFVVDPEERHVAYKARCEVGGQSCDLFLAELAEPEAGTERAPVLLAGKVAAFEFLPDARRLAVVTARRADRTSVRQVYSLGVLPVNGGELQLLDDEVRGSFALAGPDRSRLAYVVEGEERRGVFVIDIPPPAP